MLCGPADFEALNICVTRLAELSLVGVTTYSVCKAVGAVRKRRCQRVPQESSLPQLSGVLETEPSCEPANS